jgi:PilZ domain
MNRRSNERIEMKLPCQLTFPAEWQSAIPGITANMHRDGVLISCDPRDLQGELPKIGSKGRIQVELPPNPAFSRKCIVCDTTLVRVEMLGEAETQFAMRIGTVAFKDLAPESAKLFVMSAEPTSSLPV